MRGKLVFAAGALALGLTGCVAYPADPYYGGYYDGYDGYGGGYYAAPVVSGTVVYTDRGRYKDRGYYRDRGRYDRHDRHHRHDRRHR